MLFEMINGLK